MRQKFETPVSNEKTLYFTGDTVWYEAVQEIIDAQKPEIIVVNAGNNQFLVGGYLVMGKEDLYEVYKTLLDVKIIAVHMEAVNHWGRLSREELKALLTKKESRLMCQMMEYLIHFKVKTKK